MKPKTPTIRRTKKPDLRAASSVSRGPSRDNLCQFPFADGRTCRMPRARNHRRLCIFHARAEHELLAADEAARRLVSLSGDFKTASDINRVLGQLFSLLAQNRIPRRDADSLAYVAQLLLQTLPQVRNEIRNTLGYRVWDATVQQALTSDAPQSQQNREPENTPGESHDDSSDASEEQA